MTTPPRSTTTEAPVVATKTPPSDVNLPSAPPTARPRTQNNDNFHHFDNQYHPIYNNNEIHYNKHHYQEHYHQYNSQAHSPDKHTLNRIQI